MTVERINLQNTPARQGVKSEPVSFESSGNVLRGTLFTPTSDADHLPGVVVTGAWTTVKEQMPGTYARELAARGYAALAFDFTGWGESEGARRFVEDPETKTRDIEAAAAFLSSLPNVDSERLAGLGICASSGYMAAAVASDGPLKKLALVAPWLHTPEIAKAVYGEDNVPNLVAASRAAAASKEPTLLTAASATDAGSVMYQAPYYTEPDRGLIEASDTQFNAESWEPWLTYDAQRSADALEAPTLVICSEAAALPQGAHDYAERTRAPRSPVTSRSS